MNELQAVLHILLDRVHSSFTTEAEVAQVREQINALTGEVLADIVADLGTAATGKRAIK